MTSPSPRKRPQEVLQRVLAGEDIPGVAQDLGITTQAIYDLLRRRGIAVSVLRQRHPLRKQRTTVQLDPEVLRVIDEGVAPGELSRSSRVARILERLDLMYRSTIRRVLARFAPADIKSLIERARSAKASIRELANQRGITDTLAAQLQSLTPTETAVLEEYLDRTIHQH